MKPIQSLIFSFIFLFALNWEQYLFAQNDSLIQDLKLKIKNSPEDTTKINLLNELGGELRFINPDTSIILGKIALELANKINYQKGIANSNSNLGAYYYLNGDYSLSLSHQFKALDIRKLLNDKKGIAASFNNIGLVYSSQGDYPNALKHHFKSLEIKKQLNDKKGIAGSFGNIGIVYDDQVDYPNALKHYFKALEIFKELGNKNGIAVNLGNIGIVYFKQGDYPKALKHYFEANKIDIELGNKNGIAANLGNIGTVYHEQGDYPNALKHYLEALKIDKEELGNKNGIARHLGNIGSLYTKQKKYKEAEEYLKEALLQCDSIGILYQKMEFEKIISEKLYAQTNCYQPAYEHYKKYDIAKDSLFNEEKSKQIGRLEQKHEFEMAELERIQKEQEQTRLETERIERRNTLQYSAVLIFIIVLVIGFFIMTKAHVSAMWVEGLIFFTLLLFFEFLLVFTDPYVERWTGGVPVFKILFNGIFAVVIFLLQNVIETSVKKRLLLITSKKDNSNIKNTMLFLSLMWVGLMNGGFTSQIVNKESQINPLIDSLKIELSKAKEDTTKINILNDLSRALMYTNPDTSIILSNIALKLANTINYQKGNASSNGNLGIYYYYKGDYPLSLSYYFKALEIKKQINDKKGIAASFGNIGNVYTDQGDYPKALKHFFDALKINKELGNKQWIAGNLGNIGIVYKDQGDYPMAMKHFFEALEIYKELGNKNGIAANLDNIGNVYTNQGDYPKALKHFSEALEINKGLGNKQWIAKNLGNIGIVYYEQGDYSNALKHFFEALEIDKELGNKDGIAVHLGNIGSLYTKQKKNKEAEQYLKESLMICDSTGILHRKMMFEKTISEDLYAQTKRYKPAYEHYKKYSAAKDSLFNEDKSKQIGRLEQKHEFEMAELERIQKEKEQARIETARIERRNTLQYSGVFLVLLVVFAVIFVFARRFRKEKEKKDISRYIKVVEASLFIAFLFLFEFLNTLIDPYTETYTGGAPLMKLLFNAGLAVIILPVHGWLRRIVKDQVIKGEREKNNNVIF